MNRKSMTTLAIVLLASGQIFAQQPKYIFYLIGDGMGTNQVNLSEIYLADKKGVNDYFPLVFSNFTHASVASTNSLSHGVTDSAAGGTALAVGKKTKNGVIAMDSSATVPIKSIAYAAKEKGLKVGIASSVSVDHATPASFYATQPSRSHNYEIGLDLAKSNFDFFAGSGFLKTNINANKEQSPELLPILEQSGYKILRGKDAFKKHKNKGEKIVFINKEGEPTDALKYAIDQQPSDMKLADITQAAIENLSFKNDKGFFLMVEGGKIDWACHANDGATALHEVLDFNETAKLAFEFYKKHPKETLIVVTADHETGGLGVGNGSSTLNTKALGLQKVSQGVLSTKISDLRKSNPDAKWEEVKNLLSDNLGLWSEVKVSKNDEEAIYEAYKKSFVDHIEESSKSLYASDDKIASIAVATLNKTASVAWSSGGHSAAYVPVYAIGVGAELFNKKMDNTDIPKKIAEAAKFNF